MVGVSRAKVWKRTKAMSTDSVQVRLGEHVRTGDVQLLVRVRLDDMKDIGKASRLLGLTKSQFTRNVLVQVARTVIAEAVSEEAA
jgi:uncharacterized protein (DUF1778 family)